MTLRMVMLAVSLVNHVVPIPQLNSPPPHDSVSLSSVSVSDQGNANCLRLMSFLFYVMTYTFFMQQADSFFLSFSIFSLQPSASAALWTKEIKTTDVGCKSNALKREDEADHISI